MLLFETRDRAPRTRTLALAHGAAATSVLIGAIVLCGWLTGHLALTRLGSQISMKANAAVCVLMLGVALWSLASRATGRRAAVATGLAAAAAVVGALTLFEHATGLDLGIDELVVREPPGMPGTASPGRAGVPGSLSFLLLGAALVLARSRSARLRGVVVDVMLLAVAAIALLPLVGYGYRTAELYDVPRLTSIALPTAIAIEVLAVGALLAAPEEGLVSTLRGRGASSRLARRTVVYWTIAPLALGWVIVRGLQLGLYDGEFAVSILVLSLVLSVAVLSWRDAALTGRAERERERAIEELHRADRRKDAFLGMLSHELRNPLAPIRNALYILERADPAGAPAARAREIASRQVAHLTRVVDDLLDVTRIARGKVELRRGHVDVAALVRRTCEDHRALVQAAGLELAVSTPAEPIWVDGDETRLVQVLGNLLQNAVKFTPGGGRVAVTAVVVDGAAELRVEDTGAGIAPELLPSVFDAFVQGEQNLARTEGGLGLGLALVRGFAELHGGAVRATSAGVGQGSAFVVRLPLSSGPVHRAEATSPAPGPRLRVLVVDDNADAAESLAALVRTFGHEAEVAFDGPRALEMARESPPDVVLCDLGLPGMSGYEVARALRSQATDGRTRLVAVSGYARPEDRRKALEAGFGHHLAKPPDPAEIERLLA